MSLILMLALIVLGIVMRLVPHDPNFVALFSPVALAVFAGARLPRRSGWLVPLVVLAATDLALTSPAYRSWLWSGENVVRYLAVLAVFGVGRAATRLENPLSWVTIGFAGSLMFWVLTNLAVWAVPAGMPGQVPFPKSIEGLAACFGAALPFLHNSLAGDVSSTLALFGAEWLVRRVLLGRTPAVEAIPVRVR
jgi:hypothetical protein